MSKERLKPIAQPELEHPDESREKVLSPGRLAWNNFRKNKLAMIGLIIFGVLVLLVVFAPLITPADGDRTSLTSRVTAPGNGHFLGTDDVGRDMWTRLLFGGRNTLVVAIMASGIATIIGSVIGGISGYYGGKVDSLLMRFTEIIMTFPYLPTLLVLSFALQDIVPKDKKVFLIGLIIGMLGWGSLARMVRGQILSLREQEFMEATTALGLRDRSKVFKHLLPNTFGVIIVSLTISFAGAILSEVSLSFLGLGIAPPQPSWGNILQYAKQANYLRDAWWMWIPCAVLIILSVVGVNLMGEGLRDAFDPKSNR